MIGSILNKKSSRLLSLVCSMYSLLECLFYRVIKNRFCRFTKSSICTFFLLLCLGLFSSGTVLAQDSGEGQEGSHDTHAHSESHKWKGIDVTTVLGNDDYAPNPGQLNTFSPRINKYPFEKGKIIFLYNVGTGKFIIEGGNWGMEGRLFHESFGRPLYLFSDGYILSGIKEKSDPKNTKFIFGCNIPYVFHSQQNWDNWNQYSFTLMMDADISRRTKGWQFKRVEGETGDTYTYYMYEEKNNNKYFLGAAYGECHATAWKGDGQLVFMDDDRTTWTTYNPQDDTTKMEVNGDEIALNELYQWRVVSEEQFYEVLEEEVTGLNPSVAALIPDRDFTRNAELFDTNWVMEENEDADYSQKGRWGYSFGRYLENAEQNSGTYPNDAWNKPVRLKNVFEGDLAYGWQNAKYGFLTFEGVGRTYTEFEVPRPGWYMIQCYGFIRSANNDAYLFARVKGSTSEDSESRNNLVKVSTNTFSTKNSKANCLEVGKVLTRPDGDKENYKNTVWIQVTEEQFNSGQKTLQIGVGKDAATKSSNYKNSSNTRCYYDTDWVCVDDFRASYLGLGPCFFYEDEEDLEYLRFDEQNIKQYPSAVPNGRYSGATCLERTLMKNQWNSFSFPLPLTGEQVRSAFGEEAQLAYIHSIGKLSQNPNVIDFKTVDLFTTDDVVEPGQFYLLKPTKEPTAGLDPRGIETTYYELGRMFFSVNEEEPAEYTHDRMSLNTWKDVGETISSLDGEHDGNAFVNYVQTPGFDSFSVTNGEYNGDDTHGIYASMGAYVVSNNSENSTTIYHLNKDTRLKGFRGWIVLENPIAASNDMTMSVHGMYYDGKEDTGVESLPMVVTQLSADTEVYDMCGRKVGVLGTSLPKGIYLVNGRKYFVK